MAGVLLDYYLDSYWSEGCHSETLMTRVMKVRNVMDIIKIYYRLPIYIPS